LAELITDITMLIKKYVLSSFHNKKSVLNKQKVIELNECYEKVEVIFIDSF